MLLMSDFSHVHLNRAFHASGVESVCYKIEINKRTQIIHEYKKRNIRAYRKEGVTVTATTEQHLAQPCEQQHNGTAPCLKRVLFTNNTIMN